MCDHGDVEEIKSDWENREFHRRKNTRRTLEIDENIDDDDDDDITNPLQYNRKNVNENDAAMRIIYYFVFVKRIEHCGESNDLWHAE